MTIDHAVDGPIAALVALAVGVNDDLRVALSGDNAIESVLPFPIRAESIPTLRFPALSITRASGKRVVLGGRVVDEAVIRFVYVLPPTPRDRIAARWPALHLVWSALVEVALRGSHPNVAGGANVLAAAHVLTADASSPTVAYDLPADATSAFPTFSGTITYRHETREQVAESDAFAELADLIDLDAVYRVDALDLVEEIVPAATEEGA